MDAIIIGSGAGGLAAAVALARAGRKVTVFEQHYVPGGWCHSFQRGGYRFSPGVHYIGELGPHGRSRAIYEGLGVSGDLAFCELNPDGYDHVILDGERFDIPKGRKTYAERLKARFPAEKEGIDAYLTAVARLAGELDRLGEPRGPLGWAKLPLELPTLARWGLTTAKTMVEAHVRDPKLKAILWSQAGDHGLPPSLAPAAVHASVQAHYFNGGYYPLGGGFSIPRAFTRALKRLGGEVRLRTEVASILLEGKKAVGVKLADGTEVRADVVVSNADPHATFQKLVGEENLSRRLRRRLGKLRYSVSALSLYLAVDMDLRSAGLDSGNYWHYPDGDVERAYRRGMDSTPLGPRERPGIFLTVTTLKDPSKYHRGRHTLEAFTFLGYDAFRAWAASRFGDRPEGYAKLKAEMEVRMLEAVDRLVPGLRERAVFHELGTPLTKGHYLAATRGNLYGTEKTLGQLGPWSFQPACEIEGLYLCGASTLSHGVMGATMSGLAAAAAIERCGPRDFLTAKGPSIPIYPSERPERWPERLRAKMAAAPAAA